MAPLRASFCKALFLTITWIHRPLSSTFYFFIFGTLWKCQSYLVIFKFIKMTGLKLHSYFYILKVKRPGYGAIMVPCYNYIQLLDVFKLVESINIQRLDATVPRYHNYTTCFSLKQIILDNNTSKYNDKLLIFVNYHW